MQRGSRLALAAFVGAPPKHLTTVARSSRRRRRRTLYGFPQKSTGLPYKAAREKKNKKTQMCSQPFHRRQMQIFLLPGSLPSVPFTTRSLQNPESRKKNPPPFLGSLFCFDTRSDLRHLMRQPRLSAEQMAFPVSLSWSLQFVPMTADCARESRRALCPRRVMEADGWSLVQIVVCKL